MKTMLKTLAAIRTWMVALAVTFISSATLAASLPEGYTEVEYVESSGAQWIDTGILGNTGLEAEMDLLILNIGNSDKSVLSSRNGTNGRFYFLHLSSPTKLFYAYGTKGTEWTGELQRRYQVESVMHNGEQKLVVDGEVKVNSALTGDIQTGRNIYMFAVNDNGGAGSYATNVRFYHVVIKQNGTVLADFVPCRTAEGEYGFYDVQRKDFYGNGATGAPLTGGSAVSVSGGTLTIDETTGAAFLCDAAALARNRSLVLKSGEIALPMLDSSSVATFPAATLEGGTLGFSGGSAGPGQYRVTNALSVTGRVTLNVPQGLPEGTYRLIEAGSLSVADGAGFELTTTASVDPAERTLSVDGTGVTLTVEGAPKLPSGYTQVNYLESTGTEWIDTGVEAGHRTAVEMDFGNIKYVHQRALFGQDAWGSNRYMFDIQSNKFMFHGDNKDIKDPSGNLVPVDESAQYRVLVADDDTLYLAANGARVANVQVLRVTSAANKNLAVFGLNNATRQTGFRCYGLRIAENGRLVRDFVPARNYRGELGLYDRVTGEFFGNQSSGRFIGPDEIDARLSYIQSSGSQYIDTGVLGNMGLETEVDMLFPSVPGGTTTTMPLAVRGVGGNDRFYPLYTYGSKIGYRHYTMSYTEMPFAFTANTRYLFRSVLHNDELSFAVDGEIKKSTTSGITPINTGKNLCLFACNENGTIGYYSSSRVYGAKISEGGTPLRDFVPARSAGRPGVIDLANGGVFYPNKGSGSFTWGGIAYTVDGTTLKLHEGTLAAEDLADYTAIEKVDWYELNAGAVTAYAVPITLTKGVFALTDGEVKKVTVGGKLTIKGGAILKVDAIGTECDNLEVQSLDLSDATADNPIVIEIASAVGMDWSAGATLIANTGLDDGPCEMVRIADNDELQPVVKNGDLTIQMKSAAAHWTGEIGDNDPTNPGNWQERTVPTADTIVYFSGESLPNITIGTPFTAKSVEMNVTLADDYDWRGLNPNIPVTGKIDLNGHSLTVANLTGDYEITDTTDTSADDATPGELHVDVESGKTIENATVTLSGALKFVKDGEGTFAVATAQAYAGGTDVKGGTLKCGENIYPGKSLTPVTVYEGAIYDIGGLCPFGNESTVLAGGTFANTLKDHAYNGNVHYYAENPNIKVIENSAISADFTFGIIASGHGKATLDLGGKELTISIASGKSFVLDNTDVSAGTLKTTGEGTLVIDYTSCRAAETDFDLGSAMASVNVATEVKDLTVRSGTTVSGNGVISVNGVYRPLGATAPKVALKDGASFDLSTLGEALNLAGTTTTYADNATILINVGDRELETDEQVIAWSAQPANVGGLTFKFVGTKLDGGTVNAVVQDDGIYYPDVKTVVKATWTGAAGDGDPANTENWTCENALELPVPGALPGASTVVYLNGEIAFNVTNGATFTAGSLVANDVSLKGDCDWRGLNPNIPVTGKIDLNGHSLTVANLTGDYEITDTTDTSADDATPGELHVDVESGKTIENTTVTLSGALKFVKEGEGTFVVKKAQTYAGGTDVKGGTLKCGDNIYPGTLPSNALPTAPLTVYEGAVFDVGPLHKWNAGIVLAGGTLANRNTNFTYGQYAQNAALKVVADSAVDAQYSFGIMNLSYGATSLDLGGKELAISIAKSRSFWICNTDITAGTIKTTGEGTLIIQDGTLRAAAADLDLGCSAVTINKVETAEVRDLTVRSGTTVSGNGVISVNGAYRPLGATAPKVTLKDGASFDLSTLDKALNLAGTTTTFTDNTTILINVGERELETDEQVIAWSAQPANVGGLTFKFVGTKLDGETVNAIVRDDGVYYPDVNAVVKATWTGAAGDGNPANTANWMCENALEKVVPDALPGASTVVYLNGEIAFNVPSGATFAAGSVNANASLKGDCDWSGLDSSIPVTGTIDLKGHKFTVANLVGNYEVTDSGATVYERLEYIQSNGSQWIDTGVLPTYNMKAELDMKFDGAINGDYRMFGVNINNYIRFQMYCGASSFTCRIGGADNSTTLKISAHNNRTLHTLEMDGTTAKYTCGETVKSIALNTTLTQQASLYLFTTRTSAVDGSGISKNCSATFYGGKIWDGENLVRDFVPAKRVSDGAIGLLDLANLGTENEFYENKGTTAFTAGATTGRIMTKPGCDEEATPGEFHINVASGSIKNTAVTFTGTTKVVKEGEGILELGAILQTNVGGWEIAEGTVRAIASPYSKTSTFFGEPGSTVVVREGATYDLNKQYDTRYYPFILDGGTIANRGGDEPASSGSMGPITLTKNSNFDVTYSFPLWGKVDLGGLTLTVNIADGKSLYLYKDGSNVGGIFENGTVVTSGGGYFAPNAASGASRDMRTVDFMFEGPLAQTSSIDVRNLTMIYDGTAKSGSGAVNIYGVFTPSAQNYIHNFVMQDGSTLNLAGRADIYDVTSSVVTGNSNVLGFADGATINVVPGNKRSGQIVSWTEATKPAEGVKFAMDKKYGKLEVKEDGLYLHHGMVIIFE